MFHLFPRRKKWWEKLGITIITYGMFWGFFYGVLVLIPTELITKYGEKSMRWGRYYVFGIVPLLSLVVPVFLRKSIRLKWWALYFIHFFVFLIAIFFFFLFYLSHAYSIVGPEDFLS